MPIPVTPKPTYPNVPMAPGVPPLLRQIGAVQNTVVLLAADAAEIIGLFSGPQWGLFTAGGAPAFNVPGASINVSLGGLNATVPIPNVLAGGSGQSVGDMEFRLDYQIATAPQEQGAFVSYNKVSNPFGGRVTYIVSGTETQRGAFLAQVLAVQQSLVLLTLTMPEYSYPSCNVVHHGFRRSAQNGVTMFAVDIWVEEVRVTGAAAFSNTALPSGAAQVNDGTVQPQPPTPAQTSAVPAGFSKS